MEYITWEMLDKSIGQLMDESRSGIAKEDQIYQKNEKNLSELEERYLMLGIPEDVRIVINDYIDCIQTSDARYADLSYIAGMEDAIVLLKKLDLIKKL